MFTLSVHASISAIRRYGKPEIFNTDQGSQFTSQEFTQLLKDHDIARYLDFYNARRPHSALDSQTPDEFYYENLPALKQAA